MTKKPLQERLYEKFKGYYEKQVGYSTIELEMFSFIENLLKEEIKEVEESKNNAYHERDMLVCALTKLFPAYLARHSEEEEWEDDWRWIVYIDLPTGQVSWHIHDSERAMFDHLEVQENKWDGHNTERKYERLLALSGIENEREIGRREGRREQFIHDYHADCGKQPTEEEIQSAITF